MKTPCETCVDEDHCTYNGSCYKHRVICREKHKETIKAKTAPWELENLRVQQAKDDGDWTITAGGGQQPSYKITAAYLDTAINELIQKVTKDAIEDEAREWLEIVSAAQKGLRMGADLAAKTETTDSQHDMAGKVWLKIEAIEAACSSEISRHNAEPIHGEKDA
jgi:hypothetical protein